MANCKRMTSGDFASYLYKGYLITRIPPSEGGLHWNISKPNGEPFDARQTKADAKIAIDNWTALTINQIGDTI